MMKVYITLVVLLGLLVSCAPSMQPPLTGNVTVEFDGVAPWMVKDRNGGDEEIIDYDRVKPAAYLLADSVEFVILDSSSNEVATTTVAGSSITGWEVPIGTGYTMRAYVYNAAVSSITYVVSGVSDAFDVASGATTTVTTTCFPYNPETLSLGTTSASYHLAADGELWFEVITTDATTDFTLTSVLGSDTGMYIFDSDGILVGSADTIDDTDTVSMGTTFGATYYIGVREYETTTDTFTVTVTPQGDPGDLYEDNDTAATAWAISEDTWYASLQADDDWYEIVVTAGYENVLIDCQFIHAEGDIDIRLYAADASTVVATSPSTTDNEYIDCVVSTAGTYYILVHFDDAGNAYQLWWDDVAPQQSTPGFVNASILTTDKRK